MRLALAFVATGMVVAAPVAAQVGTPACTWNGGGRGTDPHPDGAGYRVVLTVDVIEFDDCYYQPSIVLPKVLR